jgi:hypothetical protein
VKQKTNATTKKKSFLFILFCDRSFFLLSGRSGVFSARRRSRHIVGSFLSSAFLSSSSFFAAPFLYFNQISPFYMLPFICMSSQCQKDVAPTTTEL